MNALPESESAKLQPQPAPQKNIGRRRSAIGLALFLAGMVCVLTFLLTRKESRPAPEPPVMPMSSAPAPALLNKDEPQTGSLRGGYSLVFYGSKNTPGEKITFPAPPRLPVMQRWDTWRQVVLMPGEEGLSSVGEVSWSFTYAGKSGTDYLYKVRNGLSCRARAVLASGSGETWDMDIAAGAQTVIRSKSPVHRLAGQVWAWVTPEETYQNTVDSCKIKPCENLKKKSYFLYYSDRGMLLQIFRRLEA